MFSQAETQIKTRLTENDKYLIIKEKGKLWFRDEQTRAEFEQECISRLFQDEPVELEDIFVSSHLARQYIVKEKSQLLFNSLQDQSKFQQTCLEHLDQNPADKLNVAVKSAIHKKIAQAAEEMYPHSRDADKKAAFINATKACAETHAKSLDGLLMRAKEFFLLVYLRAWQAADTIVKNEFLNDCDKKELANDLVKRAIGLFSQNDCCAVDAAIKLAMVDREVDIIKAKYSSYRAGFIADIKTLIQQSVDPDLKRAAFRAELSAVIKTLRAGQELKARQGHWYLLKFFYMHERVSDQTKPILSHSRLMLFGALRVLEQMIKESFPKQEDMSIGKVNILNEINSIISWAMTSNQPNNEVITTVYDCLKQSQVKAEGLHSQQVLKWKQKSDFSIALDKLNKSFKAFVENEGFTLDMTRSIKNILRSGNL